MDFHEDLARLGEKDGLKGRKLSKAVESFTWNITVLKVPGHKTCLTASLFYENFDISCMTIIISQAVNPL